MSVYPETIWLQRHEDCVDHGCSELHEGTTWCADKINETDVLYVRADAVRDGWMAIATCTPAKAKLGVIVFDAGYVGEAYMQSGRWYLPGDEQVRIHPTHWMPFPPPPPVAEWDTSSKEVESMTEQESEAPHQRTNRKWPCDSLDSSVAECLKLLHSAGWFGYKLSCFEMVAIESTMRILRDREPERLPPTTNSEKP